VSRDGAGTQFDLMWLVMAVDLCQKAVKQQATRNVAVLNRMHLISLLINSLFVLLRFVVFRASSTRNSYLLYLLLSSPAFAIEFWFEKTGRPTVSPNGEVKRSGEDLEAKGLTEYMNDVLYWTWGSVTLVALAGDWAWWLWLVVPAYSAWLAFSTFTGMRQGLAGMASGQGGDEVSASSTSNRQKKLEKRGGQKAQYR